MATGTKTIPNKPRVAITGAGIVSSIAQDVPTFASMLRRGHTEITQSERFPSLPFPLIAAELKNFNFERALDHFSGLASPTLLSRARQAGRRAPLVIQTSLIAALEAWQHAKLEQRTLDPTRRGLVIAGQNTTQNYKNSLQTAFQEEPAYLSPTYALHFMDTDQVGTLSEVFGIQGEGFTVGGASATGHVGLIHGCRLIQQNIVDCCMVVGVLADLSPMELQGFYNIGALGGKRFQDNPLKACRPFDQDREGFIWGQASGCLILESMSSAKKNDIPLLGEIAGLSLTLDAHRLSDPSLEGEARAMRQALSDASMVPSDIEYLNAHGSSSILGDETEIAAIRNVFEGHTSNMWVNSTKSLTGHCLWSAGIVEAIATLIQLKEGFVHGNLNLDSPIDPTCRFVGHQSESAPLQRALSNSFGFGGINSSIIFTRVGVGTMITHRPLHGSGRALLTHPALTSGDDAHAT